MNLLPLVLATLIPSALTTDAAALKPAAAPIEEIRLRLPIVGDATVYLPGGPTDRAILFVSGDGGWNKGVVDMARRAAGGSSSVVAGLSYPVLRRAALRSRAACWYPPGDLEIIGQSLEKQLRFPEYSKPTLLGYSSGASIVYAALAASGESFAGGMSLGFCSDLEGVPPLCAHDTFRPDYAKRGQRADLSPVDQVGAHWEILQGAVDRTCTPERTRSFVERVRGAHVTEIEGVGHGYGDPKRWGTAFDAGLAEIARASEVVAAASRKQESIDPDLEKDLEALGLPLELRLVDNPRSFFLFISGDGGWSTLDRTVTETLAQHRISTVAINTLKYFWHEKPPERVAADLQRLIDRCGRDALPLFAGGYSFGAEVVPVVLDRSGLKKAFTGVVLISPGPHASFEVSVLDWLRTKEKPTPFSVLDHAKALTGLPIFCSAGEKDDESICPGLRGAEDREVALLPGAHHYGGTYDKLAEAIASFFEKHLVPAGKPEKP